MEYMSRRSVIRGSLGLAATGILARPHIANVESMQAAVKDAINDTGIIQTVSRFTYTGAYAISFGVVYAAVFVTQFLPQDNAVMHGFSDGAQAAKDSLRGA